MLRGILYLILLLTFYQQVAASDSEVVEAETRAPQIGSTHNTPAMEESKWNPNDNIIVKPYNILEANCPQGYVLANKHCHKRVRVAATMK